MVVTYTLASWARRFCTAAAFKQASGLQQKMATSDQTYARFRPDMPNDWLKIQNGVSNYPMAYQINAACTRAWWIQVIFTDLIESLNERLTLF